MVAKQDMVCYSEKMVGFPSTSSPAQAGSPSTRASPSPRPGVLQVEGMALKREILRDKGCVIETLLGSRKAVTRKIYSKVWNIFSHWCQDIEVSRPSIPVIFEFFTSRGGPGDCPEHPEGTDCSPISISGLEAHAGTPD